MKQNAAHQQRISCLLNALDARHVSACLKHFGGAVHAFEDENWEESILKAGKFVEAAIKAIAKHAGLHILGGRKFKLNVLITQLEKLDCQVLDDALRLTIPRACRLIYDISSNRGARHDTDEVNPNKMDATVLVETMSWILAELVRYSQKGMVNPDKAVRVIDALMEKKYPAIENIDGRIYINKDNMSATNVAILILNYRYPERTGWGYLIEMLRRHGFTEKNAKVAVSRITNFVDDDENKGLRLRGSGRQKAVQINKK